MSSISGPSPEWGRRMPTLIEQIRELKTQAKNRRDLQRYDRAVNILEKAIDLARGQLEVPELRRQLASELADLYGLLGGVQRRWALESSDLKQRKEHLLDSIRAYDAGWTFESGSYGIENSYSMLNRLVSRILLDPSCLEGGLKDWGEKTRPTDVRKDLEEVEATLRSQLEGARRDDYWAAADWALVDLLLGKAKDASSAYALFNSKSPPDYAYGSVLDVLRPLAELDLPVGAALKEAVLMLEDRMAKPRTA